MVVRDRTAELHSIFDRVKATRGATAVPTAGAAGGKAASVVSPAAARFNEAAQGFSQGLASVSASIANLTKLIQQQSVFDDNAPEIGSLTTIVKAKLSKLHDDLTLLGEMRVDATVGPSTSHSNRHSEAVVSTLRSKLVNTSQSFKTVLQKRTQTIKETNARRNRVSSDKPQTFESALFRQHDDEQQGLLAGDQTQQLATNNTTHYRQRYDAVRQIESAVHEVSEMFQDFTRLVHEQDETIVRIDTEVEESLGYVNAGSSELMRYIASLSTNRGIVLKVFAVLFVFLLFFGFVVVR